MVGGGNVENHPSKALSLFLAGGLTREPRERDLYLFENIEDHFRCPWIRPRTGRSPLCFRLPKLQKRARVGLFLAGPFGSSTEGSIILCVDFLARAIKGATDPCSYQ